MNYWLLQNAFSMGIGDTIADAATMERINDTISKAKNDVKALIKLAQENALEAEPGRTTSESFENRVNQVLRSSNLDFACKSFDPIDFILVTSVHSLTGVE